MKLGAQRDYSVQSVVRTFRIVDTIAGAEHEIGAQQISRSVNLHISTAFRFLQTLTQNGVVEQNPETGKYRLGFKLLAWGMQVLHQMDLRRDASTLLRELNVKTCETVHMCVYDRGAAIYIEKIESPAPLRGFSEIGKGAPLHCTGVGKALMAGLSEDELDDVLKRYSLRRFTPNTITQVRAMRKELEHIQAQGYAIDDEEHEPGIRCVAAPVRNYTGNVIASISIAGRTTSVTPARMPELIHSVKKTAQKISTRLGYRGAALLSASGVSRSDQLKRGRHSSGKRLERGAVPAL